MTIDIDAFYDRVYSEDCAEGGKHDLATEEIGDETGAWYLTCTKCWRNFEAELARLLERES